MKLALLCALTTFAALAVAGPVTAPDLAGSVRSALPQPPNANTHTTLPADGRATQAGRVLSRAARLHSLRVAKAERIVGTFYANSGFLPHCETLVSTHERMAREHGQPGFADAWYWSLVYGGANFGLQVGGVAPGSCAGPMDVKHSPLVLDPVANIEWHCREMLGFYKRGVRGRNLCEHVMLPSAPRDWGGGRFRRTDAKFRECIRQGYEVGKLP